MQAVNFGFSPLQVGEAPEWLMLLSRKPLHTCPSCWSLGSKVFFYFLGKIWEVLSNLFLNISPPGGKFESNWSPIIWMFVDCFLPIPHKISFFKQQNPVFPLGEL